jgi:hypothetical protein
MATDANQVSATAELVADGLVGQARERTGLDDLGRDGWREGLLILVDTLESTPGVSAGRRDELYGQFVSALCNRLRVVDYLKRHPGISGQRIERPLVILGLPRTGTTVASYLLDADPARRSLLNWEAADSVPPPTTATLRTDPRLPGQEGRTRRTGRRAREGPVPHPALGGRRRADRVQLCAQPGLQGDAVGSVHAHLPVLGLVPAGGHDQRV